MKLDDNTRKIKCLLYQILIHLHYVVHTHNVTKQRENINKNNFGVYMAYSIRNRLIKSVLTGITQICNSILDFQI